MALESDIEGIQSALFIAPRWERQSSNLKLSFEGVPEHVRSLKCSTRAALQMSLNDSRRSFAAMHVPPLSHRVSSVVSALLRRPVPRSVTDFEELTDDALHAAVAEMLQRGIVEEHAPVTHDDLWRKQRRGIEIPQREKIVFLLESPAIPAQHAS